MVTMQDIAERAGVKKGTVSCVLNGKHKKARISSETCAKIQAVASQLGYRRNELARSVATGKSNVIAFVSCDIGSWEYTSKIMAGILEEITRRSYALKVYHLKNQSPLDIAEQLIRHRVDGVIFHSPNNADFQIINDEMRETHIPCATVNLTGKDVQASVTTDDFQGVKDAVEHLAGLGHRRILYFSHQHSGECPEYVAHRRDGYLEGMKQYVGKSALPQIEILTRCTSEAKTAIARILNKPVAQRPTAVICIHDAVAMEVIQVAYQIGIRIPEELSVVGFANLEMAKYAAVPLTTIAQPFEEMGRETAGILLDIVKNKPTDVTGDIKNLILRVEIVVRESTAPPINHNKSRSRRRNI